jgi:ribosomal protein S6
MLRRYETLMLTVPEITQDETKMLEKEFDRLVSDVKGATLSFERWGKYHLAYPVQKHEYGVYFLARYEVPEGTAFPEELKSMFAIKVNNFVMRTLTALT